MASLLLKNEPSCLLDRLIRWLLFVANNDCEIAVLSSKLDRPLLALTRKP